MNNIMNYDTIRGLMSSYYNNYTLCSSRKLEIEMCTEETGSFNDLDYRLDLTEANDKVFV